MSEVIIQEIRTTVDGRKYEYIERKNGSKSEHFLPTEQELQEQLNQQRIQELKTTIPDREIIKDILTQEELKQLTNDKIELKTLLGY